MNLTKKTILLSILFLSFVFCFFSFQNVQAQGLVHCGLTSNYADRCTLCDLLKGIKTIVDWGRTILVVVAMVAIVAGAIMYIVSAGDNGMMESAKGVIKQALWGVVIVLGAWVIVNTIIWLLAVKSGMGVGAGNWYDFNCEGGGGVTPPPTPPPVPPTPPTPPPPVPPTPPTPPGPGIIPEACRPYETSFSNAAGGNVDKKCLLVGIAMSESSCNPNAQNGDGCGLMQIEGGNCDYLKSHPDESIQQASQILATNATALEKYKSTFSIGNNLTQSGETVTYGSNTYDTGNDDLIASYNGGTGNRTNNGSGKKDPFAVSTDCPSPPTPAWQCHLNAGEFGTFTQPYVKNVQKVQDQCLGR